jgi:hypothetical protein
MQQRPAADACTLLHFEGRRTGDAAFDQNGYRDLQQARPRRVTLLASRPWSARADGC